MGERYLTEDRRRADDTTSTSTSTGPETVVGGAGVLVTMRPLTEDEMALCFEKLKKYIGENLRTMLDRPDGSYVLRLHNSRVYYMSEAMVRLATSFARDQLIAMGTCLGKMTKSGEFRLQITGLHVLSQFAKYRIWVKPAGEQS